MATLVSLEEASANLANLISKLGPVESIVITSNDEPVAELRKCPITRPQPKFGRCKGMLTIIAEDDEHLQDFEEYMP